MVALEEGVPVVVQAEHAHERYKWLHLWRSRRLAPRTDAIVGVSRGVVDRLRELGFPPEKLHVIYNGVRVERFMSAQPKPWAEREPAVVMAARFGQPKDQRTLIRAAALLRDRGTPIRVRLAGGGKKLELWRARWLVRRLGLGDWVQFLGPRGDLPEVFRQHQVAVMSTRREGFGLVVIEAMAAGCAVVGSRAPGVEELIEHGCTGWLATAGDPESFAEGILAALGGKGPVWAAAGAAYASNGFGVERMAAEYERLFDGLLAAKRGVAKTAGD
jgi:glycosyltransferase involved in cell wall biosynthesis